MCDLKTSVLISYDNKFLNFYYLMKIYYIAKNFIVRYCSIICNKV